MADVLDILEIGRPGTPEVTKETIMGSGTQKQKPKYKPKNEVVRKPEGMARELFNLLVNDNKDPAPLFPTNTGKGYKQTKAQLGVRKVRPWKWMPFTNPARKDGAVFHHWRRVADEGKEYPFANFNKQVHVVSYNDQEYQQHLQLDNWSKAETDHLSDLCRQFDLRFPVIQDRWDTTRFSKRTIEELKERYYDMCNLLNKARHTTGPEPKLIAYDADHEKRRKEQLKRLFERTSEQVEEEQNLLQELRKIEARKKDRERKTQDLQKLITAADSGAAVGGASSDIPPAVQRGTPPDKKQQIRKKNTAPATPKAKLELLPTVETPNTGIKFPEFKTSGVFLRSQRMKLPPSVGQKKSKAIEQMLTELGLELNPMPTEDICQNFNELRSDLVLLYELKLGLSTCEYELQSLRHQYEALAPGKTLEIPPSLLSNADAPVAEEQPAVRPKALSEVIDVVGSAATPMRKRKAALEQNNMLKKIKNRM
uniref:DNA methyltransferase 1-associated protein 1 n=1 Tax=Moina brachiata TaxID=675436 RepID=A0A4Y7NIJ2_9CRUS|nr:EOG090X076S [Moina brachiata]SVE93041.1 EOG090X076S [Moina brachiata]